MALTILNILNIDIVRSKIKVQFKVLLSWYDSRLHFKNLKSSEYYNWINSEADTIWYPVLGFHNTESKQSTVVDEKSVISVSREVKNFSLSAMQSLENVHIYKGAENKLRLREAVIEFASQRPRRLKNLNIFANLFRR